MLEKTGIELDKTQSLEAVQYYAKFIKDPHQSIAEVQNSVEKNGNSTSGKGKEEGSVPIQETFTKIYNEKLSSNKRPLAPNSTEDKEEQQMKGSRLEKESKATRQIQCKDVATQDNLLAVTIFREDYQK